MLSLAIFHNLHTQRHACRRTNKQSKPIKWMMGWSLWNVKWGEQCTKKCLSDGPYHRHGQILQLQAYKCTNDVTTFRIKKTKTGTKKRKGNVHCFVSGYVSIQPIGPTNRQMDRRTRDFCFVVNRILRFFFARSFCVNKTKHFVVWLKRFWCCLCAFLHCSVCRHRRSSLAATMNWHKFYWRN